MDQVLEQLVEHITRYLDQDISQDKIGHVLKQNDLDEGVLERAFSIVRARKAQEAAEAKAKKDAEEAAEVLRRKEAAARKKKRLEAAREAAKKTAPKAHKSDSIHHPDPDAISKSNDAEALPQDTAISLHAPTQRKNMPLPILEVESDEFMRADLDGLEELSDSEILLHDDATIAAKSESDDLSIILEPDEKTSDTGHSSSKEPSLAEELLGSAKTWDESQSPLQMPDGTLHGQQSLPRGSVIYQSTPEPGAGPQFNPIASEPESHYGSFGNASQDTGKYPILIALQDSIVAAKANLITYVVSVLAAYMVSAATFILTVMAIGKFFALPHSILLTPPSKVFVSIAGSILFYATWAILAGSFSLTIMSIALFDSSQSHRTSISAVMSKSLDRFKRVTKTLGKLVVTSLSPLAIVALIPVFAVGFHGTTTLPYILPTLYVIAFGWAVFTATRYGMAPYVALFERLASTKRTFARSQILSSGAGQLFMAKSTVTVAAVCLLLAYFIHYRPQATAHPLNIVIDLVLLAVVTAANGALVMLYCNRKLFKG